ncbi:MAG: hypothetical protein PHQ90_08445 [Sulfuricurvum sp.]|uniref:hypothetical protein n=1 Tax=Sulfuricurvum sp. TaxID=2025608 RepID=UPI00262DB907|nr:hypothetical protein [Sulfuricurvum sp.]MDD2369316.1 hypothetical protein [Sulfuricurvum sp.]MDD2950001.1 hypothetical protein [Sulfuricurvum sp.]MDD5118710.1 hypothetical protein [Sulfuricurvum sp.]
MKKAVIVVGSHGTGKSKTINKYFKPLIGLSGRERNFSRGRVLSQSLEEREGHVLSQSLEEKGLKSVKEFIEKYANLNYLVCAARPDGETPSLYKILKTELETKGFNVSTVRVFSGEMEAFYEDKAQEILNNLQIV